MKLLKLSLMSLLWSASFIVMAADGKNSVSENQAQKYVYDELIKENFIKLNRVTVEGELAACELEFQYIYRDIRAKNGLPVMLGGSFSAMYTQGKTPGYSLKVNAMVLDFSSMSWKPEKPAYTNVQIGSANFSSFKLLDFTCDQGGQCTAYADPKLKLNVDVAGVLPFDAEIYVSLNKGGIDNVFKLSEIMSSDKGKAELSKFPECHFEILNKVSDDLEKVK